jgi:hypothetical protein
MKIKKHSIIEAAIVVCIALAFILPASATMTQSKIMNQNNAQIVPITKGQMGNRDIIFQDGFESYNDFVIEFPPWTNIDSDGGDTYGIEDSQQNPYQWPNNYTAQSFIIFNPLNTVPSLGDDTALQPHTGSKFAACFADVPTSAPDGNNDWLITPKMYGAPFEEVSFWAKSYTLDYGPECIYICVSTTDTNPSSFSIISGIDVVQVPDAWTQYTYDLSAYSGQNIYIGINDISYDTFILMVDDFQVTGTGYVEDTTPPVTTCVLDGTLQGGVYTSDVTMTLTAVDTISGVNYTMYKLDDGSWTTYTVAVVVTVDSAHSVLFYSVDNAGNREENKTATFTIQHALPIAITIKGGLGVSATIKNTGTAALADVTWTIDLNGGVILLGKTKTGTIATLGAGEEVTVKDFVFGFGKPTITVTTGNVQATATGTVLLFFVIGVA